MPSAPATLSDLIGSLAGARPDLPAIFLADGAEIGAGYHITELKLADISSIDCGGRQTRFAETQMQLLDGQDGEALTVGKVGSILNRSVDALPGLAEAPLSVEFAHGNRGLGRYRLGAPEVSGGQVRLPLLEDRAQCKPMAEQSCCGGKSACCA